MSIVYVVTRGEYSDYGIEKIFSTIEAAEKYCAIDNNIFDEPKIEEYELEDGSNIQCKNVYKAIACSVYDDRNVILSWEVRYSTSPYEFSTVKKREELPCTDYIIPINRDVTSADVIKKIIHDTVAQYKARAMEL